MRNTKSQTLDSRLRSRAFSNCWFASDTLPDTYMESSHSLDVSSACCVRWMTNSAVREGGCQLNSSQSSISTHAHCKAEISNKDVSADLIWDSCDCAASVSCRASSSNCCICCSLRRVSIGGSSLITGLRSFA